MRLSTILFISSVISYVVGRLHEHYRNRDNRAASYRDKTFQHHGHWNFKFPAQTWLQDRRQDLRIRRRLRAIGPNPRIRERI